MNRYGSLMVGVCLLGIGCNSSTPTETDATESPKVTTEAAAPSIDLREEETRLAGIGSKMLNGGDSTEYYSGLFTEGMQKLVSEPASLKYPFQLMRDSGVCYVETAADRQFRIYSWDTHTGGSMHYFNAIFQWQGRSGVQHRLQSLREGDPGSWYSKIHTVNLQGKTYYLAIFNGIYSGKDVSQSVAAFAIEGDDLIDTVKLFRTKTQQLSSIRVEFDFFSVVDRPERPVDLVHYDSILKVLYVPVVDDKGSVTSKNIVYELKGDGFEFVGVEEGRRGQH